MATDDSPSDHERVERLLGEFRMLTTAIGVLVGFQLTSTFSAPFLEASLDLRRLHVIGTLFAVGAFAAFLIPASVHRVASQVSDAERFINFSRRAISAGFLLLGLALMVGLYVQSARALGPAWGFVSAGIAAVGLLAAWAWLPHWFSHRAGVESR